MVQCSNPNQPQVWACSAAAMNIGNIILAFFIAHTSRGYVRPACRRMSIICLHTGKVFSLWTASSGLQKNKVNPYQIRFYFVFSVKNSY